MAQRELFLVEIPKDVALVICRYLLVICSKLKQFKNLIKLAQDLQIPLKKIWRKDSSFID